MAAISVYMDPGLRTVNAATDTGLSGVGVSILTSVSPDISYRFVSLGATRLYLANSSLLKPSTIYAFTDGTDRSRPLAMWFPVLMHLNCVFISSSNSMPYFLFSMSIMLYVDIPGLVNNPSSGLVKLFWSSSPFINAADLSDKV